VVGAGRAGRAVAAALTRSGWTVAVLDRSAGPASQAQRCRRADTVVLAVADDAIGALVEALAGAGAFGDGQLVVHLAGSRGLAVLAPAAAAGARVAAVHPAMAMSGTAADTDRLAGAAVGVTAGPGAEQPALDLALAWGGHPILLGADDRPRWHAALCIAANFAAATVLDGADHLSALGVADPRGVLRPLVTAAVASVLDAGGAGLTGPAARGDAGTIAAHLGVLDPPARRRYRELSALTAGLAPGRPLTTALVRTRDELDAALCLAPRPRALVMTLGALHEGHLEHVRRARELVGPSGSVVLSVFLNPLQFGAAADLAAYPRTLDADVRAASAAGVDVVFAPDVATMYPDGPPVIVPDPGALGSELEGASRPGHFAGVLTVVHRMLRLVAPDVATFGEKDVQQLVLVRRLVADLGPDVEIVAVPTVREPDGLARSSRNARLDPAARRQAMAIPAALAAGVTAAPHGGAAVLDATSAVLSAAGIVVDYRELRDLDLGPPSETGPTRLLVAATVGGTRLIDNVTLDLGVDGHR
jgi:pantoate--beta-alanine ligase